MFVGHYGFSYGLKKVAPSVPLWVLFLAVQLLDLAWAPLVLLGVEKVRIVPHFTASNSIDLYYMPYTHGLVTALWWSAAAYVAYRGFGKDATPRSAGVVALAVFSHWILDFIVHVHDLPLWANQWKVGLGLWNHSTPALVLEALVLFGGIAIYITTGVTRRTPTIVFGVLMFGVLLITRFGKPPATDRAFAIGAIISYVVLAAIAWFLERQGKLRPRARAESPLSA